MCIFLCHIDLKSSDLLKTILWSISIGGWEGAISQFSFVSWGTSIEKKKQTNKERKKSRKSILN